MSAEEKSFDKRRQELLDEMSNKQIGVPLERVVPFRPNDDVPNFLRRHREFKERSKNKDFEIG